MLFRGNARHGLEPVGIMGCALFNGPILHGVGYHAGHLGIQGFSFRDGAVQGPIGFLGKPLPHHGIIENQAAECILQIHWYPSLKRRRGTATETKNTLKLYACPAECVKRKTQGKHRFRQKGSNRNFPVKSNEIQFSPCVFFENGVIYISRVWLGGPVRCCGVNPVRSERKQQ